MYQTLQIALLLLIYFVSGIQHVWLQRDFLHEGLQEWVLHLFANSLLQHVPTLQLLLIYQAFSNLIAFGHM